jgi:DNA-binding response OmpR family regulator
MKTILVVDDEPSIAQIAGDYLRHGGFGVITAINGVRRWRWRARSGPT